MKNIFIISYAVLQSERSISLILSGAQNALFWASNLKYFFHEIVEYYTGWTIKIT